MKRILVALDRSPRSAQVLQRAAALATSSSAELFLLRAVGLPPELPDDAYRTSPTDLVEVWRNAAAADLERMEGTLEPALVTHVLVRVGTPWSAICDSAREHDVDLIVLGSHGYGALDHVLGTTAAKVVNHADRSVLIVRETPPRKA
jgi:nucleotide-binding universal stress UspA family protein